MNDKMNRTLAERQAARKRARDTAIRRAEYTGTSLRCAGLMDDMDNLNHQLCRGEEKGGSGCLCRCHDKDFT